MEMSSWDKDVKRLTNEILIVNPDGSMYFEKKRGCNPMSKFDLILADNPWAFKIYSPKGDSRSASRHYPTMKLEDIKKLPVESISNKNAVLFLWVTDPFLKHAFDVIDSWGFTYKTVGFYWVKENMKSPGFFMGTGYYTRANPEQCLLATRGKGLTRVAKDVRKLIVAPRGRHSAKPKEAHRRIERLFGDVSRVELFAREKEPGWKVWGNEVESDIEL